MSRGPTARLFVALDLPLEVRETLGEWAREVARARGRGGPGGQGELRALDPLALHLTLCFLGSRPVGEIDLLASALAPCADHACELSLGAPLWLPPRQPRLLAVEARDHSGELERLQRELSQALCELCDWQPERRRFRAHITVARVRGRPARRRGRREGRGARAGALETESAVVQLITPSLSFIPESVSLYRSSLLPSGAQYEALASSALAPA
jgi:2'-5' RNA ligase